jgi:hypothetical protein
VWRPGARMAGERGFFWACSSIVWNIVIGKFIYRKLATGIYISGYISNIRRALYCTWSILFYNRDFQVAGVNSVVIEHYKGCACILRCFPAQFTVAVVILLHVDAVGSGYHQVPRKLYGTS